MVTRTVFQNACTRYVDKWLARRSFSRLFFRVTPRAALSQAEGADAVWLISETRAHPRMCAQQRQCNKLHLVKIRHEEIWHAAKCSAMKLLDAEKEKARRSRAFDECLFLSAHFLSAHLASLAIWCVRRDTFRLALFLWMIFRCAACISSGSARAIAFNAASRSPLLIASSTVRTAPRIWVRRDLLMMVRRAILRVAFLAEVVLAMFSTILRLSSLGWSGLSAPAVQLRDRRWLCFPGCSDVSRSWRCHGWKPKCFRSGAAQRTAAAGLRPPPLGVL